MCVCVCVCVLRVPPSLSSLPLLPFPSPCRLFVQLERERAATAEQAREAAAASSARRLEAAEQAVREAEARAATSAAASREAAEGRQLAEAWAAELQVRGTKMGIRMGSGDVDVG